MILRFSSAGAAAVCSIRRPGQLVDDHTARAFRFEADVVTRLWWPSQVFLLDLPHVNDDDVWLPLAETNEDRAGEPLQFVG